MFHRLRQSSRSSTQYQVDDARKLNTSSEDSTIPSEINHPNTANSTLLEPNNNITQYKDINCIHIDDDDNQQNLNINNQQPMTYIIDGNTSIKEPIINKCKIHVKNF